VQIKKRRRSPLAFLLAALLLASVCWAGAADATGATTGEVVFQSTEPDSSGCFDLTMTAKNLTFRVYQFALRYDPQVVAPVDEDGNTAQNFSDFARKNGDVSWISAIGTELNTQTGLIDFSGYIMPGTSAPNVNELGEVTVGEEGLLLYTFHFKLLQTGDAGLQVATQAKGEPYRPACPDGVIVANESGAVPVSVTFQVPETLGTSQSERFTGGSSGATGAAAKTNVTTKTVDSLLKHSLLLPVGSYAALVEGNVAAIYQGERGVTPYIKGDRTFVPVRFIAERMGAQVDWDNTARAVVLKKDGHTIRLPIGSETYTVDGESKTLDAPAELMASTQGYARTMVPIRFVAEGLGYQVEWDNTTRTVIVGDGSVSWSMDGSTEQEALSQAMSLIQMYKGFV
jgi:hypothetical protein